MDSHFTSLELYKYVRNDKSEEKQSKSTTPKTAIKNYHKATP